MAATSTAELSVKTAWRCMVVSADLPVHDLNRFEHSKGHFTIQ